LLSSFLFEVKCLIRYGFAYRKRDFVVTHLTVISLKPDDSVPTHEWLYSEATGGVTSGSTAKGSNSTLDNYVSIGDRNGRASMGTFGMRQSKRIREGKNKKRAVKVSKETTVREMKISVGVKASL